MIVLTVASDLNFPGLKKLEASLKKFGFSYHVINAPFVFGGQMPHIYEWARAQPPDLIFLYTDAYDTVALGQLPVAGDQLLELSSMIISVEKACFPHPELAEQYPPAPFDWKYVNGGGWLTTCGFFCKLFESNTYSEHKNDQLWLTHEFLASNRQPATGNWKPITLDTNCEIFQSIAFEAEGDFTYGNQLINNKTNTAPIFIHGNGRTDMTRIYGLPVIAREERSKQSPADGE